MKKGLNGWAFDPRVPFEKQLSITSQAGFDGFECIYEEDGPVGMNCSDQDLVRVKELASSYGLCIPSVAGAHYGGYSIASSDNENAQQAVERVKRLLHAAHVLGADTILLVAGSVESARDNPDASYERVYDNALRRVKELAKTAEDENVRIGIEPIWSKFLLSPLEMRQFVDEVSSPYVGVYFDVGNVMIWGYPEQWIDILGRRIFKCHFKDFRRSVGTLDGFVDLLEGDVDFPLVMKALREAGFDSYCTVETGPYKLDSDLRAYQASRALDRIFEM